MRTDILALFQIFFIYIHIHIYSISVGTFPCVKEKNLFSFYFDENYFLNGVCILSNAFFSVSSDHMIFTF